MLLNHWMKGAVIFLYLAAVIFVVSQCTRFFEPAHRKAHIAGPTRIDEEAAKAAKSPILKHAEEQARKRKERERELARARAEHHRLEAHLVTMVHTDIPATLEELAGAAIRFRNKLPDLKQLKKAEQWEREAPVKDALARARDLTSEWYGLDREAQKERDGPTLHASPDIDALTKRIDLLKRGGEDIAEFARGLPVLYPRVPEALMLSAIDAIARVVLPKDAFDPCRDPAACPKPLPPPPQPTTAEAPPRAMNTSTFCVRASASRRDLDVFDEPDVTAIIIARLRPAQCGIATTGHTDTYVSPWGPSSWQEIVVHDRAGWVRAGLLVPGRR